MKPVDPTASGVSNLSDSLERVLRGKAPDAIVGLHWVDHLVAIGPGVGSSGTAAFRGEHVVVDDIATDPLWADFRELALSDGLRACWSTPIFSCTGKVLGTFAVYYPLPRRPSQDELQLVDILTRTAGVAVERRRDEEALRQADRRKDEFLATLAHELRNPLAQIHNGLQVMRLAGSEQGMIVEARSPSNPMAATPMRRILIVDDNGDSATSLGMLLKIMGNDIQIAHDGLAAVEAAEEFRPDVILLDIGLPKLNGYDACRRIREQPWSSGMVIVALTGWGHEDDRRRSAEAGFNHHLVKPVDITALEKLLGDAPSTNCDSG